ncbi:MAG TPA: response regulator [Armatimonadota bacterium]|nr:response regulator [Armatimonadota bacterium]
MGQTILVVDDHKPTVDLIRDALTPQGFEVVSAANGAECVLAVEEQQPDLLILDVHMPVLSGLDALHLLRQRPRDHNLPVIVLSGQGDFANIRRAWKRGADIYLTKPVRIGAVVAAVKWLLRSDGESAPPEQQPDSKHILSGVVASDV